MSDRLALADAIEDAGIERGKAVRIATVIVDAIHQSVATKADLDASAATIRADLAELRGETREGFSRGAAALADLRGEVRSTFGRQDVAIERLRSEIRGVENRVLVRLGGGMVLLFGLFFAALQYWPPHG
jgi:hypothetical protein